MHVQVFNNGVWSGWVEWETQCAPLAEVGTIYHCEVVFGSSVSGIHATKMRISTWGDNGLLANASGLDYLYLADMSDVPTMNARSTT